MTKAKNRNWFDKHLNDMYVLKSKTDGYRSRASYKLLEILQGKNLIQRNDVVVDLGSAPGGWSQVARKFVGSKGRVLALDILEMSKIPSIFLRHDDCSTNAILHNLKSKNVKLLDL